MLYQSSFTSKKAIINLLGHSSVRFSAAGVDICISCNVSAAHLTATEAFHIGNAPFFIIAITIEGLFRNFSKEAVVLREIGHLKIHRNSFLAIFFSRADVKLPPQNTK